jgi:hypothetical protein
MAKIKMPSQAAYDAYCDRRRGYGFTCLDFRTWTSWEINAPLAWPPDHQGGSMIETIIAYCTVIMVIIVIAWLI